MHVSRARLFLLCLYLDLSSEEKQGWGRGVQNLDEDLDAHFLVWISKILENE